MAPFVNKYLFDYPGYLLCIFKYRVSSVRDKFHRNSFLFLQKIRCSIEQEKTPRSYRASKKIRRLQILPRKYRINEENLSPESKYSNGSIRSKKKVLIPGGFVIESETRSVDKRIYIYFTKTYFPSSDKHSRFVTQISLLTVYMSRTLEY